MADAAGIGGQLMTVADAKIAIEKLLATFEAKAAAASPEELAKWDWRDVRFATSSQPVTQTGQSEEQWSTASLSKARRKTLVKLI